MESAGAKAEATGVFLAQGVEIEFGGSTLQDWTRVAGVDLVMRGTTVRSPFRLNRERTNKTGSEQGVEGTESKRSGAQKSKLRVGVNQHVGRVRVGFSAGNSRFLESALLGYPNATPTRGDDRRET